eukprot:UN12191
MPIGSDQWKACACISIFWAAFAGMIVLVVFGISVIESGDNYDKYATKEQCEILSKDSVNCNCGNQCIGKVKWTYIGTSYDKCGNLTLTSEYEQCEKSKGKDIGSTHTCYIIDCENEAFTLKESKDVSETGWTIVIIGGLFALGLLAFSIYGTREIIKECQENYQLI